MAQRITIADIKVHDWVTQGTCAADPLSTHHHSTIQPCVASSIHTAAAALSSNRVVLCTTGMGGPHRCRPVSMHGLLVSCRHTTQAPTAGLHSQIAPPQASTDYQYIVQCPFQVSLQQSAPPLVCWWAGDGLSCKQSTSSPAPSTQKRADCLQHDCMAQAPKRSPPFCRQDAA